MTFSLDPTSRATVTRFVFKVYLAAVLPVVSDQGYFTSLSQCLFIFGLFTGFTAMTRKQLLSWTSFNHVSESLWLLWCSSAAKLAAIYL